MMFRATALMMMIVAAAAGCENKLTGGAAGSGGDGKSAKASEGGGDAEKTLAKLQKYIECLNRHSKYTLGYGRTYLNSVKGDVPSLEDPALQVSEVNGFEDCAKNVAAGKATAPSPEIAAAADAYVAALTALQPLTKQAHDYYARGNQKDDKLAKGLELHPKLVAAFEAFSKANNELQDAVGKVNRAASEASIAQREKEGGNKLQLMMERLMLDSETLAEYGSSTDWEHLEKVDAAAFGAKVTAYEKLVDDATAYGAAHKTEKNEWLSKSESILRDAQNLLKVSKDLLRRIRDKTPWSKNDMENLAKGDHWISSVDGAPGKLIEEYNDLVENYNRQVR